MQALRADTVGMLPASVHGPRYALGLRRVGIVHLGLGGFHRAHMARYTHELMQQDAAALDWAIAGAGLLPADRRIADSLGPQDGLYTLVERSGHGETVSVVGSVAEVIYAGDSSAALLDAIARPEVRIVSLTVTEHGYCLNRSTRQLDPDHELIRADLASPDTPRSAIGIIVESYRRRMQEGRAPFTALTCDNIQHNGNVLRDAVLALARLRAPAGGRGHGRGTAFRRGNGGRRRQSGVAGCICRRPERRRAGSCPLSAQFASRAKR